MPNRIQVAVFAVALLFVVGATLAEPAPKSPETPPLIVTFEDVNGKPVSMRARLRSGLSFRQVSKETGYRGDAMNCARCAVTGHDGSSLSD